MGSDCHAEAIGTHQTGIHYIHYNGKGERSLVTSCMCRCERISEPVSTSGTIMHGNTMRRFNWGSKTQLVRSAIPVFGTRLEPRYPHMVVVGS